MPAGHVAVGRPVRGAGDSEPEVVRGAEAKRPVEEAQAAITGHEVAVGDQAAQMRAAVQVVRRAPDERPRIPAEGWIGRIVEVAWCFVLGEQHAERRPSLLAGHLHAVLRINDGPRMDEGDRATDLKNTGAL